MEMLLRWIGWRKPNKCACGREVPRWGVRRVYKNGGLIFKKFRWPWPNSCNEVCERHRKSNGLWRARQDKRMAEREAS